MVQRTNPIPFDEAELLDYVEGAAMNPATKARLVRLLEQDPGLARMVEGMRADRLMLVSMAKVSAPEGLIEGVESMLERQALLGLVGDERRAHGEVPASTFGVTKSGVGRRGSNESRGSVLANLPEVVATLFGRSWIGGGLAVAATLAMAAGAAFYLSRGGLNRKPATGPEVVLGHPVTRPDAPGDAATHHTDDAMQMAHVPSPNDGGEVGAKESGAEQGNGEQAIAAVAPAGEGEFVGPPQVPDAALEKSLAMTAEQAAKLALEGRLIVRVRSGDLASGERRIDAIAKSSATGGSSRFRLGAADTVGQMQVAAAVRGHDAQTASDIAARLPKDEPRNPSDQTVTSASGIKPGIHVDTQENATPADIKVKYGTKFYCASLAADAASLETLCRVLVGGRRDVKVEFGELAKPLDVKPVLDAGAVLWWSKPLTPWPRQVQVPVVVQDR